MGVTYRAEAPDQIVIEHLGAIDLLYHCRSGATHLVAAPMPQILEALGEGPATVADLIGRLAAQFDFDAEEDMASLLEQRLAELAALGLVRVDG